MNRDKVSRIQIENSIIINKEITHNSFGLYVVLKSMSYIDSRDRVAKFYINTIKDITGWKDNRTLKKHFDKLEELSLIESAPQRFNVGEMIVIKLIDVDKTKGFTQVDRDSISNIIKLTKSAEFGNRRSNVFGMALRLFYYYEKNYNQHYGKAFPSYEAIRRDTGISYNNIKKINDYFNENRVVIITQGGFIDVENQFGDKVKTKQSNAYIPVCNRRLNLNVK